MNKQYFYYMLLVCTSLLWGGNFVAGKFMVGHTSSLTLTDLRWGVGILCLIPIVWLQEKRLLPPKGAVIPLIFMGLTGVVFFNLFMFWALERTTASNTGLISALNPLSIAVVSFFLMKEKMNFRQIAGMFVSLFGVIIVMTHGEWQRVLELRFNLGDLFMVAAVLTWGFYAVASKAAMKYVSPLKSTLWGGIFGLVMLVPFDVASFYLVDPDPAFWMAVFYIGVLGTVLGMGFWNIGVKHVGGTTSGMFLNLNPIFAAIFSFLLLGEQITLLQAIGTVVVIGGLLLFSYRPRRKLKMSNEARASSL